MPDEAVFLDSGTRQIDENQRSAFLNMEHILTQINRPHTKKPATAGFSAHRKNIPTIY
jgi:hypothetical protein